MRSFIDKVLDLVDCLGNRAIAPLFLESLQASQDTVCQNGLFLLHRHDVDVLLFLFKEPT